MAVPGLARAVLKQNPDLKGELGYFPIPGKDADRSGAVFTGGSDPVVPANTGNEDGAIEVVSVLTGAKWNTDLARPMNHVPAGPPPPTPWPRRGRPRPRRPEPHRAG